MRDTNKKIVEKAIKKMSANGYSMKQKNRENMERCDASTFNWKVCNFVIYIVLYFYLKDYLTYGVLICISSADAVSVTEWAARKDEHGKVHIYEYMYVMCT